jgi:hypothetical protein
VAVTRQPRTLHEPSPELGGEAMIRLARMFGNLARVDAQNGGRK